MSNLRVPAGLYRELIALRELRRAVRIYHDRFMLDEIETAEVCCVEGQHEYAVSVHDALENAEADEWKPQTSSRNGERPMTTNIVQSISDEQLAEIESLASKAHQGQWSWDGREVDDEGYVYIPECSYLVGAICLADQYEDYQNDCDYIAAVSPKVVAGLIARLRAAEVDAERYRWLRERSLHLESDGPVVTTSDQFGINLSDDLLDEWRLDEAVDAAMAGDK